MGELADRLPTTGGICWYKAADLLESHEMMTLPNNLDHTHLGSFDKGLKQPVERRISR